MSPEEDFSVLTAVLLVLSAILMRPFTTFIHEMGHALPALVFSKNEVRVYVGTYGDPEKCIRFRMGRILFFFEFNSFQWGRGVCWYQPQSHSRLKLLIVTAGGPFFSLLFGLIAFYFSSFPEIDKGLWFVLVVMFGSCTWDFLVNMIPSDQPVEIFKGPKIQSDGFTILQLLRGK